MPYRIERSKACPADHPYAVILEATGEKVACHRTRKGAQAQIAAIYASEAGRSEARKQQPTSTDVHVPTIMGGSRRRRRRKPSTTPDVLLKGDFVGHPFRGNQWMTAEGQSRGRAGSASGPLADSILTGQRDYRVVPETVYGGGTRYVKTLFVDGRQTSWQSPVLHQTPEQAEKAMGKFRKETEAILTSESVRAESDADGQTTVSWDEGRAGFGRTTKRVDFEDDEGSGSPAADAMDALAAYTKDSVRINNALRSGTTTKGPLDDLMESGPAETLHRTIANDRGTADRLAAELRAGNDIVDKGYSSTSRDRLTAQDMDPMGDGLLLEVRVPEGSPRLAVPAGTYIMDQEEVILPHGTRFRPVREFEDDDGRVGFVVEVVGSVTKGDYVGHPFRGNQWVTAEGQSRGGAGAGAPDPAKDEQAWRMRQEGRSWEDIARELGYANGGSVRRLAMRHEARLAESGATPPPAVPEVIEPAPAASASGYRNGMKEPTDDMRTALLEGRPLRALVELPAPILAAEASFKARHEGYLDAKQRADAAYEAQFPPPIASRDRFKSGTTPEQRAEWDRWDRGREAWLEANRPELIEAREQAARARDEALIVAGEMHADLAWRAFGFTTREADDTTLTVARGEQLRRDPEGKLKRYDDRERLTSVPAAARMAVSSGGKESLQSRWSREAEAGEDGPQVKHANWSAKDLLAAGFTEQQVYEMAAAANGWQNERIRMILSDEHHTAETTDDIRRGRAVRQERQDHLVKAIGDKPLVSITIPASKVKGVMESGRYKTQFETGKSGGYNVPQVRAEWESYLFGYPPYMDPAMRPVSGMVETGGLRTPATRGNEQYGDAVIVLKPSVRERATVTDGDSLRLASTAGSLSNPSATTWASYGKTVLQPPERTYLEAQIHGGVPTSDMQMVIFTGGAPSAAVQKSLKAAGVPWHVATTDAEMAALEASVVQKRRIFPTLLIKGDYVGHPFRGNQWATAEGQSRTDAAGSAVPNADALRGSPPPPSDRDFEDRKIRQWDAMKEFLDRELDAYGGSNWQDRVNDTIGRWIGDGYKEYQRAAQGSSDDAEAIEEVEVLDEAIQASDHEALGIDPYGVPPLFRGYVEIDSVQVGDTLDTGGGFMSFTLSPLKAMPFSRSRGGVMGIGKTASPVLRVKKWDVALPVNRDEAEMLMPKGTQLKVVGRTVEPYGKGPDGEPLGYIEVIDCEVV